MKGNMTSEAVSLGHPDKLADRISDAVLDACLRQDPDSRVACETLCTVDKVVVAGEITTKAEIDIPGVARDVVRRTGYDQEGFAWDKINIENLVHSQSPDISMGVTETESHQQGAGDQGMMFGYAEGDQSTAYLPAPIYYAHLIMDDSRKARTDSEFGRRWLQPDAKCQLTFTPEGQLHTLVLSHQHKEGMPMDEFAEFWKARVKGILPQGCAEGDVKWLFNPTGRFVVGGPVGDTGVTGRKIIADTYGGFAHHGGGAFSGKDPSKVDRSAAYMCRLAAKAAVARGLAKKCEICVSYAIGVAEPVSLSVDAYGTGDEREILDYVKKTFDFRPRAIVERLGLKRPFEGTWSYEKTAECGHFGWDFPWEDLTGLA
ncbi:MAG: methionine adenosyltransferase [Clostridia bacterium]|nr:methionine adenosyltransferase [Clostridia bacterium]